MNDQRGREHEKKREVRRADLRRARERERENRNKMEIIEGKKIEEEKNNKPVFIKHVIYG